MGSTSQGHRSLILSPTGIHNVMLAVYISNVFPLLSMEQVI